MKGMVLSLFPGIDLFGRAFEQQGYTVLRGPDLLFGGDIKDFHLEPGLFEGIIGGPPCTAHSRAAHLSNIERVDLISDFVRITREAKPEWLVMENVPQAMGHDDIPHEWFCTVLSDWQCGGPTCRKRAFWSWPFPLDGAIELPPPQQGKPLPSVMATTWKRGNADSFTRNNGFLPGNMTALEYGRLQGAEDVVKTLNHYRSSKAFSVHLIGNGVPMPMGRVVAKAVKKIKG